MTTHPIRLQAAGLAIFAAGLAWGDQPTPEEARAIAREAYVYGFPLVDNYRIQYTFSQGGRGQVDLPLSSSTHSAQWSCPCRWLEPPAR